MGTKKANSNSGEVGVPQTFNASPALAKTRRQQCLDGRKRMAITHRNKLKTGALGAAWPVESKT